jgi:hypothetical protein
MKGPSSDTETDEDAQPNSKGQEPAAGGQSLVELDENCTLMAGCRIYLSD